MKQVKFLLLAAFVAMFTGCQNEEIMEQDSEKDKPVPTGDTRIIIEGEGMLETSTRSSDGRVDFTGGYATGAGLYDGTKRVPVEAHPDAGYEVNYFYGGPANQPKKYDYAQSGTSEFDVDLGGQDHTFHCGFKEKKRTLTINAGEGGTTNPEGTREYQVEKPISITATPESGYEFTGWTVIGGDVTIENPGSSTTTATLHGSNSTITANFKAGQLPLTIAFTLPADEYIMKNQTGSKIRLTPWNGSSSPHTTHITYHFDNESQKHKISLKGENCNLESDAVGIRIKSAVSATITIPKENARLVIDQISRQTIVNEKGRCIDSEKGYLMLENNIIYTNPNPAESWESYSPTTWQHYIPLAVTNMELLKEDLKDGDVIRITGYAGIIGDL